MKFAFRILMVASFACLGMGSCSTSVEQACRDQLPQFQQQLAQLSQELAQYDADLQPDRAIASVDSRGAKHSSSKKENSAHAAERANRIVQFPEERKQQWQDWSEKRLVEMEHYLDYVHTRSQFRAAQQPLSEISNELVKFDGYVDQGKVFQASETLRRAQLDAEAVARLTCTP